jgi:hypothetical protein
MDGLGEVGHSHANLGQQKLINKRARPSAQSGGKDGQCSIDALAHVTKKRWPCREWISWWLLWLGWRSSTRTIRGLGLWEARLLGGRNSIGSTTRGRCGGGSAPVVDDMWLLQLSIRRRSICHNTRWSLGRHHLWCGVAVAVVLVAIIITGIIVRA